MKVSILSERQKLFAEEHHNVIEDFLRLQKLPVDEFYDVVVFRFLNAVKQYDECDDLKQYEFAVVANRQMSLAVDNHFEKERIRKKGYQILSLDYVLPNSNLTYGDIVADKTVDICREVCEKLSRTPRKYRLSHIHSIKPAVNTAVLGEVICVQG